MAWPKQTLAPLLAFLFTIKHLMAGTTPNPFDAVLWSYVKQGDCGPTVLEALLPNGIPHATETALCDYKLTLFESDDPGAGDTPPRSFALSRIVKDIVAFYNSFGGYILVGVKNSCPPNYRSFNEQFDTSEVNREIRQATGVTINWRLEYIDIAFADTRYTFGLFYVPQRPNGDPIVRFQRNSAQYQREGTRGCYAYKLGHVYIRTSDESRPVENSEHDWKLLLGPRLLVGAGATHGRRLPANLPPRDPELLQYIGRPRFSANLWEWFADFHDPKKIPTGPGGFGKTTIACRFAEEISRSGPMEIDKVVWLGAKTETISVFLDQRVRVTRTDFKDTLTFLHKLLSNLSASDIESSSDTTQAELSEQTVTALQDTPALVVCDDVDTLAEDEQIELLNAAQAIFYRTVSYNRSSKILFTSRYQLPVGARQVLTVRGMERDEFAMFVKGQCELYDVDYDVNDNALEEAFYAASLGSPIFASSIIRLASTGEDLRQSVGMWRGKDGEEVRQYAFKRELDRLETRDARLLYALCVLGDATKQELEEVTETPGEVVKTSISNLKKFHVLVDRKSTRFTDPGYSVSSSVVMLKDIIAEGRFTATECRAIETKCARVVKRASNVTEKIGRAIREIISLQRAGSYDDALFAAQKALKTYPQNGDLHYFSDLVCLEREPPLLGEAESHFVRAHKLKTKREELPSRWVRARELREDWRGIIDLCDEYGVRRLAFRDCRAVIAALDQLIEIAIRRGDLKTAKEHAAMGGKVASEVFIRETTRERRTEMLEVRNRMLRSHVELAKRMVEDNADSHLDVFFAVMQCIENNFVDAETVRLGVKRLESWWQAVERRPRKSEGSLTLLRNQVKRFRRLERAITYQAPARTDVLDELRRIKIRLESAGNAYMTR